MPKACNFDNVMGTMLGMRETNGLPVDLGHLEQVDNSGKLRYAETVTQWGSEVYDAAKPKEGDTTALKVLEKQTVGTGKEVLSVAKNILQDVRNPSGVFGDDVVLPVIDFITEHHEAHADDIQAGRKEYMAGIQDVFDEVDTDHMSPQLLEAWNKYRQFYESGGELYRLNERGALEKGISNIVGNAVKTSTGVGIGNVLEGVIKLPTLYPKTLLPALAEAWQSGMFKEIPELARKGVYGISYAGDKGQGWRGLIGATDIPLKNISYFAGKLHDGNGLKAVQRVAFTPRFGDLPAVYYSGGGRMGVQLVGYTINTYKLYASLWQNALKNNDWAPVITYHALAGIVGGGATAAIPAPLQGLIETVSPDSKDWFEEHRGALTKLVQPGSINRLGAGYDIAKRHVQSIGKDFKEGQERLQQGDARGLLDLAMAGISTTSATNGLLGDFAVQKALRMAKDVIEEELAPEDVLPEVGKRYKIPFAEGE